MHATQQQKLNSVVKLDEFHAKQSYKNEPFEAAETDEPPKVSRNISCSVAPSVQASASAS